MAALALGAAAGVLGLNGWRGFLLYFVGSAVVSGLLWMKARRKPREFFLSDKVVCFDGILGGLLVSAGDDLLNQSVVTD